MQYPILFMACFEDHLVPLSQNIILSINTLVKLGPEHPIRLAAK